MKNENEKIMKNEENIEFRKVMRGFDPEEVRSYIAELAGTMQNNSKLFESRMEEVKQELALCIRERDTLRDRCASAESGDAPEIPIPSDFKAQEEAYQAEISELKKALSKAEKENAKAKDWQSRAESAEANLSERDKVLEQKEQEIRSLHTQIEKQESLQELYEEALSEIEHLKAQVQSLQEEKAQLLSEEKLTKEHLQNVEQAEEAQRTELSRLMVENGLLCEKNEQFRAEIAQLKAQLKAKAYEYAEKLSSEENALQAQRTKLQKQVQMQGYHIDEAKQAAQELLKQLDLIRTSFEE